MKLHFSNEDYYYRAMAILGTDCKSTLSDVDAFLILIHGLEYEDVNNLCKVLGRTYNIDPRLAYKYIQEKNYLIKPTILEIAESIIDNGLHLGNRTYKNIKGATNTSSWLTHSLFEARLCRRLAMMIDLNPNIAYNFGLLHDYGRKFSHKFDHVILGFEALVDKGLFESRACLTHSFLNDGRFNNNEIPDEPFEIIDNKEHFDKEYDDLSKLLRNVEYTDYDRILNIADLMASDHGILPPIDRIYDILSRRLELDKSPNRVYFLTSFYNTLQWFIEKLELSYPIFYLDHTKVTLEQIYTYLKNISEVFYHYTMGEDEWTK